jgi:hypothetical protein
MTRTLASCAALALAIVVARTASAEPLADIDVHVIRYDKKQEIAIAVVDSIWRLSETKSSADSTYTVTCPITGTTDQWYLRVQRGDTIQVNFSQKRLSIPSTGIPRTCNCVGKPRAKPRLHALRAMFSTSVGLKDSIKVPGRFGPKKIGFRLRISWDTEFTLAAPDPPRRSL